MNLEWMARAACAGSELDFYDFVRQATEGDNGALDEVKFGRLVMVCGRCRVLADCAAYALANQERYGVWAGTSPTHRSQLHQADDPVGAVIDKADENAQKYGTPKAEQASFDEAEPGKGEAA